MKKKDILVAKITAGEEQKNSPAAQMKAIREPTGLSQVAFAEKYHIPRRTLENWESGSRIPPQYVIELLKYRVEN